MTYIEQNFWAGIEYFNIDKILHARGLEEGLEKGMENGIEKDKMESAIRGLQNGMDNNTIAIINALDEKVIKKLAKEMKINQNN